MADLFNRLFSRLGSYNDELDYEEESEHGHLYRNQGRSW